MRFVFLGMIVLLGLLLPLSAAEAQETVLTIALPEFMRNSFDESIFDDFEAQHGVTVQVVFSGFETLFVIPASNDVEQHLEDLREYVASADVLAVTSENLTPEAVRAGLYLDLTPLVSADPTLNVADFYNAAWNTFQWDNATWGLPVSVDVSTLIYNPGAFDEAGIAYPNESWTLDDLANAARALTIRDEAGAVTRPGFVAFQNVGGMIRSLYGQALFDGAGNPTFNNAQIEALLAQWRELEEEGVFGTEFSGLVDEIPLRLMGVFGLGMSQNGEVTSAPSLLPAGTALIDAQGAAVSSGTRYPELAYELAKYLSNNVHAANNDLGVAPARRSLGGLSAPGQEEGGEGPIIIGGRLTPENQAFVENALEVGLGGFDLRFSNYVGYALSQMREQSVDAVTALQTAEAQAINNLQLAADQRDDTSIVVATPIPAPVLQPGEIALDFGILSYIMPMPNRDLWEQLAADFAAADPEVGLINLVTQQRDVSEYTSATDCFFLPSNAVPGLDISTVINFDPFMDADAGFDRSDVVGGALAQLQKDNRTWAYPLEIRPSILSYHSGLFEQAGVPAPIDGWSIEQFVDALQRLKEANPDAIPFTPMDPGGTYLQLLIAAFGGLPIDYRTNPVTINFTDPATVDAIRQVLDLAKDGYIDYSELARTAFMAIAISSGEESQRAITTSAFFGGEAVEVRIGEERENPYRSALYPRGTRYAVLTYDLGAAYISASTENPEACYRWITYLASHPELFTGMPARRSLINSPEFASSADADTIYFYNQVDALMQDPSAVVFPSVIGPNATPGDFVLHYLLNRAFDRYVLEDADLEAELAAAQTSAEALQGCIAAIQTEDRAEYRSQVSDCAVSADPSLSDLFPVLE